MTQNIILLPFRAVFYIARAIIFPSYLRWVFRMHWVVYAALAAGLTYWASQEYQTYMANRIEAQVQVADGPPDLAPLSKWNAVRDVSPYGEVQIEGLYFPALQQGEFDPFGLERRFILLADDLGREVKAALVVMPDDMAQLERQLTAQGSGDRIRVAVNGSYNRNSEWAGLIAAELVQMNVPSAQDIVVIEPFIGTRASAIHDNAAKAFGVVAFVGGLAAALGVLAAIRFLMGRAASRKRLAPQTQVSGRKTLAARQNKQANEKPLPSGNAPSASPWGTFQPRMPAEKPPTPKKTPRTEPKTRPAKIPQIADIPAQPPFKSVFSGGASGFRFKSADEIIRQSFGTLHTLTPLKRAD